MASVFLLLCTLVDVDGLKSLGCKAFCRCDCPSVFGFVLRCSGAGLSAKGDLLVCRLDSHIPCIQVYTCFTSGERSFNRLFTQFVRFALRREQSISVRLGNLAGHEG